MKINHILELVITDAPDIESTIQTIYDWHFQRTKSQASWAFGAAGTLLAIFLTHVFTSQSPIPSLQFLSIILAEIALLRTGANFSRKSENIADQYFSAIKILNQVRNLSPFLKQYRRAAQGPIDQ